VNTVTNIWFNKRREIYSMFQRICGLGSSVGVATGYGLDGPGIESQGGRGLPHLPRPALGTVWTPGSFPGVESGRGVALTPHSLLVPRSKNRVELYLY
jgi:hypothetical protein